MPEDYKKEWMKKSAIDYFPHFISLWLACNSWYQFHYSDLKGGDRDFINKIKTDTSGRNHLYTNFCSLIEGNDKHAIAFKTNIELLHYALQKADLKPSRIDSCSLEQAVIDYDNKNNPENLIMKPKINKDGSVHADDKPYVIKLDRIYVTSDKSKLFAGLFEIIYQVRNMLVHGKLNPKSEEHDVVKYCYIILWDLMNDPC